ncbi:MAG: ABC transporter substrate-binding protein [Mariprofundus sp.]|nr:ABC transporter substrate-binding protein [Mariprofundus sp.]
MGRYVFVLLMLLVGCQPQQAEQGLLRMGLAQMPVTLDPRYATDAASLRVQALLHRGLLKLDDGFQLQADLAVSWQHETPLLWRFKLKPDIHFSDGSRLTAADVVATFSAVMNKAMASPLRAGFAAIDRLVSEGEDIIVIHLSRPDGSLPTRLNLGILPSALAMAPQQARSTIGCGLFKLSRWDNGSLTLARVKEQGSVAKIRFSSVKDPVTRVLKLTRGELDFLQNDLPPQLLPYLAKQAQLTMQTGPSTTFSYLGLNLHDERLKKLAVRRALALALDRHTLKKALFSDLPVLAETVLTPSHWAATQLPETAFDLSQAALLLDHAGLKKNAHGIRFSLNYRTSTDPARLKLATAIAAMWRQLGVDVKVESLEWGGFYSRIKRGDFQVFSLAWVGINDPDIYRWILHSSMQPPNGSNRGRYANAEMDTWLDQAAASSSLLERQRLYRKIEKKMHDEVVYIPLWYDPVIAISGPRVRGFVVHPDGSLLGLADVQLQR